MLGQTASQVSIERGEAQRRVGTTTQVTMLTERVAADVSVDDSFAVAQLLRSLRDADATEQIAVLAERAATDVPLKNPDHVTTLIDSLRDTDATEQVAMFAERALIRRFGYDPGLGVLLHTLVRTGAIRQAATLTERLPAAGHFPLFIEVADHRTRFRFGREPDNTSARRWSGMTWSDRQVHWSGPGIRLYLSPA
jgi:hypothetical protein